MDGAQVQGIRNARLRKTILILDLTQGRNEILLRRPPRPCRLARGLPTVALVNDIFIING